MSGKLIIITPDGAERILAYEGKSPGLETLQMAVGGYIERITAYYKGKRYTAWVDEDGIPKNLEFNTAAVRKYLPMVGSSLTGVRGTLVIEVKDEV